MSNLIDSFRGEWRALSNYSPHPASFEGVAYSTAEHAFAAAKTTDPTWRHQIWLASTPGDAKKIGRKIPLRPGWDAFRHVAMGEILASKFAYEPARSALLATGRAILVEGNSWHDTYWGVCECARCEGKGANYLGCHLMALRGALL